ncbi:MAG: hypothetical protein IKU35_06500 [Bacteroidaceae bacterium]|nr:hypothetical protein [Bacteroidaceae bacterium]
MGKIDTTAIEGYDAMTPEQKLAALENLELAEPDYSGYVKKEVFDKTASDLAKLKKENMAKLSEDERAKQERDEELQKLKERNAELERNVAITTYKAQYLAMGYDDALATDTAQAWADGDHAKVIANTAAFLTAHDKQVKAGMLGEMKTPPAGSGTKTITAEEIMQIKDDVKRQQMIADHLDLFQ